jgi:hypothetical protein
MDQVMKQEFSNAFADVEIQPIQVAGETVPTRVAVRVKDDAGEFGLAGIVGRDYQLLPNRKVRDIAEDIMSRTPDEYGGFRNLKTAFDGKRYVDYFVSNNPIASIVNGDTTGLMLGLMVWNAYDGSRKTGFECFALNPFCTNQYHSRNRFGYFAWRHSPGQGVDMEDAITSISHGVQNIIAIAPRLGLLKHTPLALPLIIEAKAATKLPQSRWGDVLDQLGEESDSAFGLYQALTNVASHKLTGMSAIDIGSSITEFFLSDDRREVMHHTTPERVIAERADVDGVELAPRHFGR